MKKKTEKKTRAQRREDNLVVLRLIREARPIYGWLALACQLRHHHLCGDVPKNSGQLRAAPV